MKTKLNKKSSFIKSIAGKKHLIYIGLLFLIFGFILFCLNLFYFSPSLDSQPVDRLLKTTMLSDVKIVAIIGDFGNTKSVEREVSKLIKSWNPESVITVGDNNYIDNSMSGYDLSVGQFFHEFIFPYRGKFGPGSEANRFFPALGNHDWDSDEGSEYLEFFTLPGNERYYDFLIGQAHFFVLNSNKSEPDGVIENSIQYNWLKNGIKKSPSKYQIVISHHSPYSSGKTNGSTEYMRWPFKELGAEAVLSGDEHVYERLKVDGITYFVNGAGGWVNGVREFSGPALPESIVRYDKSGGAMILLIGNEGVQFSFVNTGGEIIDTFNLY